MSKTLTRFVLVASLLSLGCKGSLTGTGENNENNINNENNENNVNNGLPDGGTISDMTVEPQLCKTPEAVFERETWPIAGSGICAGCHLEGGVAENQGASFIVKHETALATEGILLDEFYAHNLEQFRNFRTPDDQGIPLFISKAMGKEHGGGLVAQADSPALEALNALEQAFLTEGEEECEELPPLDPIADLAVLTPQETLRKSTMMLAGRMPTDQEMAALDGLEEEAALAELETVLDGVMRGQGFHEWLKYAWNEIFMFRGLWELDVTFEYMVMSEQDFGIIDWGFINRAGGVGCDSLFEGQMVWQRFNYPDQATCENNGFARNYMQKRVANSLIEEPLELIAYIVQQDMPFTEVLTTDIVMMNYYSSSAYFGSGQAADNPFVQQHLAGLPIDTVINPGGSSVASIDLPYMHEFHPMTEVRRNRRARPGGQGTPLLYEYRQPAEYPRSGILSSQLWLTRYPTTDTNVNRHRTWAYMNQFLGVDILALADRRGDPAEAELNSEQPTIDDPNCNVCHDVMDPIAGLFQDFRESARWQANFAWPPADQPPMILPGSSIVGSTPGVQFDEATMGMTPIEWLGQITTEDPRFASTMVRHAFLQLTGHPPMSPPTEPSAEGWRGVRTAYELETQFLNQLREGFVANDHNMKWLYKQIIISPYYRAKDIASPEVAEDPERLQALAEFGIGDQLLTPFEFHRKIESFLNRPWQYTSWVMRGGNNQIIDENAPENDFLLRFNSENDFRLVDTIYRDMYGGIDFMNNTSRLTLPSSVMAAAGRRMAYELACASVAQEFAVQPRNRALFGMVDVNDSSQSNAMGVEQTITTMYERMLGVTPTPEELATTTALFDDVLTQGRAGLAGQTVDAALPPHCQADTMAPGQIPPFTPITDDNDYGIRAWMAVMSYIALDSRFLFTW